MTEGVYFSSSCHLTNPRSTLCNSDLLLSRRESKDIDEIAQNIAHGVGAYALPNLKGPRRGRYIAVLVLREVSGPSVAAFAAQVYQEWAFLKCGQLQRSGCSNSVVLVVATSQKAVVAYAGQSPAAVKMVHDFARVQDEMIQMLNLWREDALSGAIAAGVKSIGHLTKYVEPEPEISGNDTFVALFVLSFILGVACALRSGREPAW